VGDEQHLNEREVRAIVVEEIIKHVNPLQNGLAQVAKSLRALYSNGSGGPPGYLETARKEDDERYDRIFGIAEKQIVTAEEQAKDIKEVKDWIAIFEDRREQNRIRWTKYKGLLLKIGVPILGALLTGLGWGVKASIPVVKSLVGDYLKSHPMVMERLKNSSESSDPALSSTQHHAEIPFQLR
jgi:hypothetical protein